jgi:DNA-binding MarR family transcriptional regulator
MESAWRSRDGNGCGGWVCDGGAEGAVEDGGAVAARGERALGGTGLTFTQWLVLDALDELIAETDETATQTEVAARLELDHGTISLVMRALADRALVDRGPDFSGRALRVLLTSRSERLLRECAGAVELASRRFLNGDAHADARPIAHPDAHRSIEP